MSQYKKIAINFTEEEINKLDEIASREQGVTRSDLVREAVDYYLGYYVQRESMNYISPIISETIKSILHHFEDNISELIFKLAVEVSKNNIITAYRNSFDDEILSYINTVSRQLVAEHNGVVDLKTAQDYLIEHNYLNSGDE